MLPVIAAVGPIKIYSMGILLFLGLFLGLYYWWKLGRDENWDEISLFDSFFLSLIAFLLAGRLGYVILHWQDLGTVYRTMAFLTYPGISYLTGIVGSILSAVFFARSKDWDVWKMLDILAVTVSLVCIFGFFGSLLDGSNPGRLFAYGMNYPGIEGKRLPIDLWGILISTIAFGTTVRVRKNFRFYAWYKGSSSVAKEGLAALIAIIIAGIYFGVNGWLKDTAWSMGPVPVASVAGLLLVIYPALVIYRRTGRTIKFIRR